jgi:hypothetical protein
MKKNLKMLIFTAVILELNGQAFGFCGDSHANLTQTAIFNSVLSEYLQNQLNIQQGLNGILTLDQSVIPPSERIPSDQLEERIFLILPLYPTVRDLLECGSRLEDIPNPRAKHHFHDPYRNAGLNNKTEHPALSVAFSTVTYAWYWGDNKFDLTGASNLKRASNTEDPNWEQEYENFFAWPDARNYFYKALTKESPETRVHYLAMTFLSLGHVLHLLEDMGVPPHARNDFIEAHFRGLYPGGIGNPLEKHVEDEIKALGAIPDRWLDGWTPQAKVFSKLAHYWDVNNYLGQYAGTSPPSNWGLSERTNYQFLSQSTIFRENIIINEETGERTKYYFPHPDVNHTSEHIDTEVYLWGLVPVDYRYISGYDITHLARTKFTQKYAYMSGMTYPTETVAYHTTFDERVYEDYAKVTIPRTIDYATGLANYFFRGRLSAEQTGEDGNDIILTITNLSENSGVPQTLKAGAFELYWDDPDGNRTKITDFTVYEPSPPNNPWNSSTSTLAYNQSAEAIFTIPEGDIKKYILVYKGNICQNPANPDLDDPEAIAVQMIPPPKAFIIAFDFQQGYCEIIPSFDFACNYLGHQYFNVPGITYAISPKYLLPIYVASAGWYYHPKSLKKVNTNVGYNNYVEVIWSYPNTFWSIGAPLCGKSIAIDTLDYIYIFDYYYVKKLQDLGNSYTVIWTKTLTPGGYVTGIYTDIFNYVYVSHWVKYRPDNTPYSATKMDSNGNELLLFGLEANAKDIIVTGDNYIYVLYDNRIEKYNQSGVLISEWIGSGAYLFRIEKDSLNNIIAAGEGGVYKFNSSLSLIGHYPTDDTNWITDLKIDTEDNIYLSCCDSINIKGKITKLNPNCDLVCEYIYSDYLFTLTLIAPTRNVHIGGCNAGSTSEGCSSK